ncbi:hypothetical protein BAMY6614_07785 [Bacillus amyloliquefaciens UMAF6614]|nr:hypothetical protein BAMY6614_07785 [Bacillus amyloliquefaciens UMAF6614]
MTALKITNGTNWDLCFRMITPGSIEKRGEQ